MSPPPHPGQVRLRGAANFEVDRMTEALDRAGPERIEELLRYHGFEGPLPYDGTPGKGDTVHVALLLLRAHLGALTETR